MPRPHAGMGRRPCRSAEETDLKARHLYCYNAIRRERRAAKAEIRAELTAA